MRVSYWLVPRAPLWAGLPPGGTPLLLALWLELLEGLVELGDDDGHGQGEVDHGDEDEDAGDHLATPRLRVHVPVADLWGRVI